MESRRKRTSIRRPCGIFTKALRIIGESLSIVEYDNADGKKKYVEAERIDTALKNTKSVVVKFPEYQTSPFGSCVRYLLFLLIESFPLWIVLFHGLSYWIVRYNKYYKISPDPNASIEDHFILVNKSGILFTEPIQQTIHVGSLNVTEISDGLNYFFNTLVFLFPLFFMNRINKFQTSRLLFQSLCGDVKAMAIYLCSLTDDLEKYELYDQENRDSRIKKIKEHAFYYYIKMRYMLCVLPAAAKHVLRGDADVKKLDDKFRVKLTKICTCCGVWTRYKPIQEAWSSTNSNTLEKSLFNQIDNLQKDSGIDLFEACMLVLLDIIHEIQLRELGYSLPIERDFIGCWNRVYGAWGPLYTNNTSRPPALVNALFYFTFMAYSIVIPWTYLNHSLWGGYVSSVIMVLFFSLMLWIGKVIQDPFQAGGRLLCKINPTVSKDSRDTQKQVYNLMKHLTWFDRDYHFGYMECSSQEKVQEEIFKREGSNVEKLKKKKRFHGCRRNSILIHERGNRDPFNIEQSSRNLAF